MSEVCRPKTLNSDPTGSDPPKVRRPQVRTQIPRLSKSRFMAGLQCHKRLYLELYTPEIAAELDETTLARFRTGTAVGELACQRFAGGRLVAHDHEHHADAEVETRALLDDPNVPALYEGAFSYDHVAVRADIIARRRAREFDLMEVKSTASWKEPHLFDLAVQLYVLEGAGMQVGRACLMHLNRDYVYQGGAYDLQRLFTCADLTERVRALQPDVAAALSAMRKPLWADGPPQIAIGSQCMEPHGCPFYDHCHGDRPEHPTDAASFGSQLPSYDRGDLGEDLGSSAHAMVLVVARSHFESTTRPRAHEHVPGATVAQARTRGGISFPS